MERITKKKAVNEKELHKAINEFRESLDGPTRKEVATKLRKMGIRVGVNDELNYDNIEAEDKGAFFFDAGGSDGSPILTDVEPTGKHVLPVDSSEIDYKEEENKDITDWPLLPVPGISRTARNYLTDDAKAVLKEYKASDDRNRKSRTSVVEAMRRKKRNTAPVED